MGLIPMVDPILRRVRKSSDHSGNGTELKLLLHIMHAQSERYRSLWTAQLKCHIRTCSGLNFLEEHEVLSHDRPFVTERT